MGPAIGNWHAKIQTRVSNTAVMLGQIKFIKMTGLSGIMNKRIQQLRDDEIEASKKARWLNVMMYSTCKWHRLDNPALNPTLISTQSPSPLHGLQSSC